MSEIYDAISRTGGHPLLDHDLEAYRLAMQSGDSVLAAEIIKSATHVADQIRSGMLSTTVPKLDTEVALRIHEPEDVQH